jgi:hypothetical protein
VILESWAPTGPDNCASGYLSNLHLRLLLVLYENSPRLGENIMPGTAPLPRIGDEKVRYSGGVDSFQAIEC